MNNENLNNLLYCYGDSQILWEQDIEKELAWFGTKICSNMYIVKADY